MEKYEELKEKAKITIKNADHMLTMTYPALNEPKILISVNNNILTAIEQIITAILEYEKKYKRIPPFNDEINSKINIFKDKIISKYKLDPKIIQTILDLKEIKKAHEESQIEFTRKSKFVMADENYQLRTITATDLKKHLTKAKLFIEQINLIIEQNDRRTR